MAKCHVGQYGLIAVQPGLHLGFGRPRLVQPLLPAPVGVEAAVLFPSSDFLGEVPDQPVHPAYPDSLFAVDLADLVAQRGADTGGSVDPELTVDTSRTVLEE